MQSGEGGKQEDQLGHAGLFFGCRRPGTDFIFKSFLEKSVENGVVSQLNVAFSKGSEVEEYKENGDQYVQDLLTI